jgi:formiminotetrahydrofolate cyclodeaminase
MDRPATSLAQLTLAEFSERLASEDPVPGGGSASAVAGALAASLLCMVARLSLGRPKYEQYRQGNEAALDAAESARRRLLELADADARAYGRYTIARQMPRDTEEQQRIRTLASQAAAREASDVPLAVVRECAALLEMIEAVAGRSNVNAASDLEVGARLAMAGGRGAAANALINLPQVGDERYAGVVTAELGGLLQDMERDLANVTQRVAGGGLRDPAAA